jgi:hypothetical protein
MSSVTNEALVDTARPQLPVVAGPFLGPPDRYCVVVILLLLVAILAFIATAWR